ncbi:right-handed parallel beta-helix repeat-containing protein [Halorubrum sp. BOL3-1]|uniref:right-handed parallel beta-helix repeat-containing protein n=1 Tax=Halorubrum sp. BOL3-1 TaxID=2497325 RepID=UPI001408F9AA|nr:right-handed parallel beta-helix repeat-containing protein [Halorubrum sp. BOL3-1]
MVVVSMLAVGGFAVGPAAANHTGSFPSDEDDLASDEILVDDDFEDGEVNESDQIFDELGPALEEAEAAFTVYVAEGDYTENAVVDTNVDLIGENEGDDQFDGVRIEADDPAEPALNVQTDGLTVTHMTIVGGDGPGVLLSGSSGTDNVKNLNFEHNIVVAGDGGTGFDAVPMSMGEPDDGNELIDNTFTVAPGASAESLVFIAGGPVSEGEQPDGYTVADNTFTTETPTGSDDGTTGISLHLESDNAVVEDNQFPSTGAGESYDVAVAGDNNEVQNNDLSSSGFDDGLYLVGEDVSVTDNVVDSADDNGVNVLGGSADVSLSGNEVSNSGAWGVNAAGVTGLDVVGNTVEDNLGGVLVTGSSTVDVSENTISDSELEGVSVSGSETVAVSDNDVDAADDLGAGIDVSESSDVSVLANDVTANDDGGISLADITAGAAVNDNLVDGSGGGIAAANVAGGLTVDNNDVTNNDDGLDVSNVTGALDVMDNLVDANEDDGITVDGVAQGDTAVTANEVTNNDDPAPDTFEYGISVVDVDALDVSDNLVESNDVYGVVVDSAGDITAASNTISDHGSDGLSVSNAGNVTATSNDVSDVGDGITATGVADVDASDNTVSDADIGIGVAEAAEVSVTSSDVSDIDGQAIGVNTVATATVAENVIESAGDGIAVGGAAIDASVTDNDVSDVGTGIAIDAAGTDEPVDVERNVLDAYDTGIHFEAFDAEQPPYATYNDLLDEEGVDVANDGPTTVEALLNYYDTDADVSHSDVDENAAFEGDVLYDPFLTVSQSDVSVQEPENTQEFGHELTLEATPNTSDPQVVAFPASVDGTVEEVFSDLPAGASVFAYDASEDEFVPGGDMANESVGALDAFVVTDLDEDATIAFEYPSEGTASPGVKQLEEGWNLVGAPKKTTVSTAFSSVLNGQEAQVNHLYGNAADQPAFVDDTTAQRNGAPLWFESTEDASGQAPSFSVLGNEPGNQIVSPYTGYWVSIDAGTDDATVTGALPDVGATTLEEIQTLETDETEDEI